METLSRLLHRVALPTFRGRTLSVISDYKVNNQESDFDVVGILIADLEASGAWNELRNEVRAKFLVDSRRMTWKKLNSDKRKGAAFLPFLRAADQIEGLAIALAFHRDPFFQIPKDGISRFRDSFRLSSNWKPGNVQHMFRIAYSIALLVAGLSRPGQDIHWLSDEDAVFANERSETDTVAVFARLLTMFSPHQLGQVRYGTSASGDEPLFQEDLLAVPDLMCGATCEIFTAVKREFGNIPQVAARFPKLASRSQDFLSWYAAGPWPLKRYICTLENGEGRSPSVGILPPSLLWRSSGLAAIES